MENCIFCKIGSGVQPCLKICEDESTIAFMDIAKDVDGHILVIPKKHYKNILDCDCETLSSTIHMVKFVSNHLVDNCGFDGVNILNNSGKSAEQSVFHLHIHILPRKDGDGKRVYPELVKLNSDLAELRSMLAIK